jgi:glycosyltransferase involved in cell wall biosynthesis
VKVLLATDSFPPKCGGSGWSTFELARGLRANGHEVVVVQPKPGAPHGPRTREYEGIRAIEAGFPAPGVPYLRNYYKNERLYPALAEFLSTVIERERVDIVHGQHVLTSLPSIAAAHRRAVPAVCTVRDYWPVCYWSDLIHSTTDAQLCPACSSSMMMRCVRPRGGALWPLTLPMIPYMRANLARKRSGLAGADAIIAVSSTIAADLRERAPEVADTRLETIPNPVDVSGLRAKAAALPAPLNGPYALYLGKLAPNKGTTHLVEVAERAALEWPLVIAGDGPDRAAIEAAAARSSRDIRLVGWVDDRQATAWLAHAAVLVFTSRGPESLSRVLLEASALGVPIAAMNTGGTPDIVTHGETGLLSPTPQALADDVRRLVGDEALRRRLGTAAMPHAERTFDTRDVVRRVEGLYAELVRSVRSASR